MAERGGLYIIHVPPQHHEWQITGHLHDLTVLNTRYVLRSERCLDKIESTLPTASNARPITFTQRGVGSRIWERIAPELRDLACGANLPDGDEGRGAGVRGCALSCGCDVARGMDGDASDVIVMDVVEGLLVGGGVVGDGDGGGAVDEPAVRGAEEVGRAVVPETPERHLLCFRGGRWGGEVHASACACAHARVCARACAHTTPRGVAYVPACAVVPVHELAHGRDARLRRRSRHERRVKITRHMDRRLAEAVLDHGRYHLGRRYVPLSLPA
eukprot:6049070-Pleurochrysis_carterae.AAC.1